MEQNGKTRNKPTNIQALDSQQRLHCKAVREIFFSIIEAKSIIYPMGNKQILTSYFMSYAKINAR